MLIYRQWRWFLHVNPVGCHLTAFIYSPCSPSASFLRTQWVNEFSRWITKCFADRHSLSYFSFFSAYIFFFLSSLFYWFWRFIIWARNCFNLQLILPHCWPVPSKLHHSVPHDWLDFQLELWEYQWLLSLEVSRGRLPPVLSEGSFQKTHVVASQICPSYSTEFSVTFQNIFNAALIFSSLIFACHQLKEILGSWAVDWVQPGCRCIHIPTLGA